MQINGKKLGEISDFSFLPPPMNKTMLDSLPERNLDYFIYTILRIKDCYYAFSEGHFNVYKWNGTKWVDLYNYSFFGYNYRNLFFNYQGDFYSMGGYGYFQAHVNLLKFDTLRHEWNIVVTHNKPENVSTDFFGIRGDSLYALFGCYLDESTGTSDKTLLYYRLNLQTKTWTKLSAPTVDLAVNPGLIYSKSFDLKDYIVQINRLNSIMSYVVFDKVNETILQVPLKNGRQFSDPPLTLIINNKITFYAGGNQSFELDLDHLPEKPVYIAGLKENTFPLWGVAILVVTLFVLSVALVYISRKKKSKRFRQLGTPDSSIQEAPDHRLLEMIRLIEKSHSQPLNTSALDEILGISTLSYDNKRLKRASMIKEINSYYRLHFGTDLILRKQSGADKRYVEYEIVSNTSSQN